MYSMEDYWIQREEDEWKLKKRLAAIILASLDTSLSEQETAMLWLFLLGQSISWIAADYKVSERQVENCLQDALTKVCVVLGCAPVDLKRIIRT